MTFSGILRGISAATLTFCFAQSGAPALAESTGSDGVISLDQGWSKEQSEYYHYTTQGTAMLPLTFWKHLEQADSEKPFSDPAFLEKHGVYYGEPNDKLNPEGLPIGLALRSVDKGLYKGDWVGFTCTSCHNGLLFYKGKKIRIDGGSNHMFNMANFGRLLRDATQATVDDDAKLDRLVAHAKDDLDLPRDELIAQLRTILKYLDYFADKVAISPHDFGPGRMDALTQIHNTLNAVYIDVPENIAPTMAPTKSPFVWNAPQSAWVQWSGTQYQPITRNLGESLGAMVRVNLDANKGEMFESTVSLEEQLHIEKNLWSLAPPKWPEAIFGKIDRELAAKGKKLVQENCSSCHSTYPHRWSNPRQKGKRFLENAIVPQSFVGTDDRQFQSAAVNPLPIDLTGQYSSLIPAPYTGAQLAPPALIQDAMKQGVLKKYLPSLHLTDEQKMEINNYAPDGLPPPSVPSYKAAPLDGMWAVPPYLHNSSVPSIYDLLLPAAERPKTWTHGRDFDPKKIGLDTSGDGFVYDTTQIGNSNAGHSFEGGPRGNGVVGRALSEDERWAIVEYMKMLPEKTGQAAPYGGPENPVEAWYDPSFFNVSHESGYRGNADSGGPEKASDAAGPQQAAPEQLEKKAADEDAQIERIKDVVLKRMAQTYPKGETMKRDAHPKTHGLVHAKLVVQKGLPKSLRQGIFAKEREYDAVVRFSASSQIVTPDVVQQPQGMAIKVFGVDGPKLLEGHEIATTQDFVMINAPIFFTGDLGAYADLFEAQLEGGDAVQELAKKHPDIVQAVGKMIADGGEVNNVFAVQYWSETPYRYGPHIVKFSARPQSGASNDRPDVVLPEYLRTTMVKTIGANEVRFEFVVQVQNDPKTQPVEDPTVAWKPEETQEIRVATLIIPKQDLSSGKDLEVAENLSFSAWHSLEAHRPLGGVNRARREVYLAGAKQRRDANGVKDQSEPTQVPQF